MLELSLQEIKRQMVKEYIGMAVTLRSLEEFYISLFRGAEDPRQKARFLKTGCDAL